MNMVNLGNDWDTLLAGEFEKEYYKQLRSFLVTEYKSRAIYPSMYDIFNALKWTPFEKVRVVILGQDPYHGPGQAHGLCFSVQHGIQKPPSLQNIFKEMQSDIGLPIPEDGCLENWAKNGVLLLNTVLTVRGGEPNSHKGKGWEVFTDRVIELLNGREGPMAFLLWGAYAKAKAALLNNPEHLVLTAAHPSPLSISGFSGCRHFSKVNEYLARHGEHVDWSLQLQQ